MQESGRKSMNLPNGKATSDSRGPAAHHGGLTVHTAQAVEAVAPQRRGAPARAGAGWGEDDLGRGMKTQGRSESRPSRKARRGFGTRRRSKASRPSKSRRTSRERGLATAHGAGESRTRRCPGGTTAQAVARSGVSLGVDTGGTAVARQQGPASSEAGAPGSTFWPFVRARKRQGWRAMVAVEVRATGRSIPIRDAMLSLPLPMAGRWRLRCEASFDGRASGGARWTLGPRGDEVCASGRDPWHGVVRTRADPARWHGGATARGQRAAGTRYRLPMRTDSEGKLHCGEGLGSPGRHVEQSAGDGGE